MTYEQWLEAFNEAPGGAAVLAVLGVSLILAWVTGHFTSKAIRNGGKFRRLFVAVGSGFLIFMTISGLGFGLAQTLARAPLIEDHPDYADRQRQEGEAQAAARETGERRTRSSDPAVQACADIYRFNTNSADPDEWARSHDIRAGRKRAVRRYDGSALLHEGQQVYNVVIPRNGDSVSFDRNGMSRDGSSCQLFLDPETGAWRSPYGL